MNTFNSIILMDVQVMLPFVLLSLATTKDPTIDRRDLARSIKEGDHQAFRRFFDRHYDSLLRFVISNNTVREAAEDIIQKAFIYIWEHRDSIDPDKSLRSYIFRIAYTRMLNHHRDNKKFNTDEAVPEQETTHTPEDVARKNDLEKAIENAIDDMPEKRGLVFTLCFVEDLTYKEAAETLDLSPKTIENHMGLALKDIRKSLENFR